MSASPMSERNRSDRATFMLGNKYRRGVCITDFHSLLSPLQPLFNSFLLGAAKIHRQSPLLLTTRRLSERFKLKLRSAMSTFWANFVSPLKLRSELTFALYDRLTHADLFDGTRFPCTCLTQAADSRPALVCELLCAIELR